MNSLVSTIETLGHRIERWAAMISDCLATTLAGILLSVLQLKAQLSEPMVAKLEAIGRSCELFRRKAHNGTVRSATAGKARTKVDDDLGPPGVADATKLQLIAAIKAAVGKICEARKIALSIRSRSMAKRRIARPVEARMTAARLSSGGTSFRHVSI